jgi:glyoxylase-like metal-dependent hydrolase (beta-lactamase superfamily II)
MAGDAVIEIGAVRVIPVRDGVGKVTPAQLFAAAGVAGGAAGWDRPEHRQFLDDRGRLEMPVGCFVVRTGDRTLLVDAGYGPHPPATVEGGASLLQDLQAHGISPDDITDVVLTHLHMDHIGWSSLDGTPVFPRATVRCDARDWEHFVAGADDPDAPDRHFRELAQEILGPIESRVETWTGDTTLAPGVDTLHAPGHTPGNTVVALSSGSTRALLLGDVVHCPAQLLDADLARIADVDEALARRTQERIAREIEQDGTPVVGAHFAGLSFGRLLPAEGRRRWVVGSA